MLLFKEKGYAVTAMAWHVQGFLYSKKCKNNPSILSCMTFHILSWLHLTFRLPNDVYQGNRK
jgi:hypothetical protein